MDAAAAEHSQKQRQIEAKKVRYHQNNGRRSAAFCLEIKESVRIGKLVRQKFGIYRIDAAKAGNCGRPQVMD
jgi:hypothetical protein